MVVDKQTSVMGKENDLYIDIPKNNFKGEYFGQLLVHLSRISVLVSDSSMEVSTLKNSVRFGVSMVVHTQTREAILRKWTKLEKKNIADLKNLAYTPDKSDIDEAKINAALSVVEEMYLWLDSSVGIAKENLIFVDIQQND